MAIILSELPEEFMQAGPSSIDVGSEARVSEFGAWYRSSFTSLAGLAALLVGSTDVAADLTQDALVGVLGKWGRLDDPDRYARRAVVNICKTYLRRQRLVQRFAAPSPASTLDEHDRTGGDMDARLRAGLATLRVPERTVLVLRFWMDLPDREIAEIMGIKPGTVSSHVHRGLRQLREAIDDV